MLQEFPHDSFQIAFAHLSVGNGNTRLGQDVREALAHAFYGGDLVVQEVDLAAALQFAQAGFTDDSRRITRHESLDRQTLFRRGGNHREIAQAFQRHRQGARYRRRGQRQHIHLGAQGLEGFFLAHAEAVFLVDDDQAETREFHLAREQPVGADHDIDGAVCHAGQRHGLFRPAAKARQLGEFYRPIREAIGESLEVLSRQQRGRREHRHLHAVGHRDERGAQGDLGLAEADIAANQAVHGFALAQVLDHRIDGGELIRGFVEAERFREGIEVVLIDGEGAPMARCALRIEVEQFRRGVADLPRGAALGLVPDIAAQPVQRRLFGRSAAVASDQMQLRDRDVELVGFGVLDQHKLGLAFAQVQVYQSPIAADAVVQVHHRIAGAQFGKVAQHAFDRALPFAFASAARVRRDGKDFRLGDDGSLLRDLQEAIEQRCHGQHQVFAAAGKRRKIPASRRFQPVFGQVLRQCFTPSRRFGQQQGAARVLGEKCLERVQRVGSAALDGHRGQRREARQRRSQALVGAPKGSGRDEKLLGGEEQLGGRKQRPCALAAQQLVTALRVAPESDERGVHVVMHAQRRLGRQIIEQCRGFFEK